MAVTPSVTIPPKSSIGQPIVVANEIAFASAAGQITGLSPQLKFGHNPASGNGTEDDIWAQGGNLTWMSTASVLDIVSTVAADDGNPTTSTGAQTITVEGLDSSWNEQSVTYTLDGTTIVTTAESWIRVNRAFVATW